MDDKKIWNEIEEILEEGLRGLKVGCNDYRTFNNMSFYVKALMGNVQRKNSWQLAEVGALKKELMKISIEHLGTKGCLTFDDTGFLKKGDQSAGVQRQYSGTA